MDIVIIVVVETKELYVLCTYRSWPFLDHFKLGWISPKRPSRNDIPKILNRILMKRILLQLNTKIFLMKILENSVQMTYVLTLGSNAYQNIIEVHNHKVVKKVEKHLIH